jgi:hypothetical protein
MPYKLECEWVNVPNTNAYVGAVHKNIDELQKYLTKIPGEECRGRNISFDWSANDEIIVCARSIRPFKQDGYLLLTYEDSHCDLVAMPNLYEEYMEIECFERYKNHKEWRDGRDMPSGTKIEVPKSRFWPVVCDDNILKVIVDGKVSITKMYLVVPGVDRFDFNGYQINDLSTSKITRHKDFTDMEKRVKELMPL